MRCPVCNEPMIVLEVIDIEVDHCVDCGGVWLDEGELELLLEGSKAKEELLGSLEIDNEAKEKKRKCPRCSKRMEKISIGTAERILIDKCPVHDGIWFDGGELMAVIRMGSFPPETKIYEVLSAIFSRGA